MEIEDVLQGRNAAVLMDNNILAADYGIRQLEKICRIGCRVDFNQGLDSRLIASNPEIPEILGKIKWIKGIRFACDSRQMMETIEKSVRLLRESRLKSPVFCYVLLTDLQSSLERLTFLKKLDIIPFAQHYRDFTRNQIIPLKR